MQCVINLNPCEMAIRMLGRPSSSTELKAQGKTLGSEPRHMRAARAPGPPERARGRLGVQGAQLAAAAVKPWRRPPRPAAAASVRRLERGRAEQVGGRGGRGEAAGCCVAPLRMLRPAQDAQ